MRIETKSFFLNERSTPILSAYIGREIRARVIEVLGNVVRLRFGKDILEARLEGSLSVKEGQDLFLGVQKANNSIRLSILNRDEKTTAQETLVHRLFQSIFDKKDLEYIHPTTTYVDFETSMERAQFVTAFTIESALDKKEQGNSRRRMGAKAYRSNSGPDMAVVFSLPHVGRVGLLVHFDGPNLDQMHLRFSAERKNTSIALDSTREILRRKLEKAGIFPVSIVVVRQEQSGFEIRA